MDNLDVNETSEPPLPEPSPESFQ